MVIELQITEDGSPTARLSAQGEPMHSLCGAFSETLYIYGPAISEISKLVHEPRFLSVGLGLGYNEILIAALALRHSPSPYPLQIESFESVPELRENFVAWIQNQSAQSKLHAAYEQILHLTAAHFSLEAKSIHQLLQKSLKANTWKIRESLTPQTKFEYRFQALLFDAFSSKTSPDLWTEEFLTEFLKQVSDDACVLSTYACTGTLKRSLKTNGFQLYPREGFGEKRESTYALRKKPIDT